MSERKTTLKILGIVALIGLIFALVVGCSGGQQSKQSQQAAAVGPKVLFFHADY